MDVIIHPCWDYRDTKNHGSYIINILVDVLATSEVSKFKIWTFFLNQESHPLHITGFTFLTVELLSDILKHIEEMPQAGPPKP